MSDSPNLILFTKRELEIIALVSRGLKPQAMSEILFISNQTVYVHLRNIAVKLELRSRSCKMIAETINSPADLQKNT